MRRPCLQTARVVARSDIGAVAMVAKAESLVKSYKYVRPVNSAMHLYADVACKLAMLIFNNV